jgi:hypothetical protein
MEPPIKIRGAKTPMRGKKHFILLVVILLPLCLMIFQACSLNSETPHNDRAGQIVAPESADHNSADNAVFDKKLSDFIELANSLDPVNILGGLAANNAFRAIIEKFSDLLVERQSVTELETDTATLLDERSGFFVNISAPLKISDFTYRFVEISNKYVANIDGAISRLFLQFWTADKINYTPLIDNQSTAGELTYFADYRFFEDEGIISVIQIRNIVVFTYEDLFNLFLFKLQGGNVINVDPGMEDVQGNSFWRAVDRDYSFYDPDRALKGISVHELIEGDNEGKVDMRISGSELTVFNIETPQNCIKFELENDMWKLTDENIPGIQP